MFRAKVVEKIKTIFFFLNRAVYEGMMKHIVEQDRPPMPIWRMRIAC